MFIGVIWRACSWLGCVQCSRHVSTVIYVIYYVCLVLGNRMETATQPQFHHPTIWSNAQTSTKILDKKHKTKWNHLRNIARISTPIQQQQQQQASQFSLKIIHHNPYQFSITSFYSSETWTKIRWAVSRSVVRPWLIPRIRRCVRASKTLDFHRGFVCNHANIFRSNDKRVKRLVCLWKDVNIHDSWPINKIWHICLVDPSGILPSGLIPSGICRVFNESPAFFSQTKYVCHVGPLVESGSVCCSLSHQPKEIIWANYELNPKPVFFWNFQGDSHVSQSVSCIINEQQLWTVLIYSNWHWLACRHHPLHILIRPETHDIIRKHRHKLWLSIYFQKNPMYI